MLNFSLRGNKGNEAIPDANEISIIIALGELGKVKNIEADRKENETTFC